MRDILFRGKRVDNGGWVEGCGFSDEGYFGKIFFYHDTFTDEEGTEYHFYENVRVHTDTVCQYTGLQDKNGAKIFEGDIVKYNSIVCPEDTTTGRIEMYHGSWSLLDGIGIISIGQCDPKSLKVIGNIFDNSELWEENQ